VDHLFSPRELSALVILKDSAASDIAEYKLPRSWNYGLNYYFGRELREWTSRVAATGLDCYDTWSCIRDPGRWHTGEGSKSHQRPTIMLLQSFIRKKDSHCASGEESPPVQISPGRNHDAVFFFRSCVFPRPASHRNSREAGRRVVRQRRSRNNCSCTREKLDHQVIR